MTDAKKTTFRPASDGFAFPNHWTFDQNEKDTIHKLFQGAIGPVMLALAPLLAPAAGVLDALGALLGIPVGTLESAGLVASITGALNSLIDASLPEHYGLCGGMAFAALDYYDANLVIQRGFRDGDNTEPQRNTPEGTILRNYIWQRLIDSLTSGVAQKTLEWMAILHFIPQAASGGAPELLRRTKDEWRQLKQHLDAGTPWPLGLIGTTKNPMDNHQVLAYGYLDNNDGTGLIYVYDNNCPDAESTIQLDFRSQSLSALESCGSATRGLLQGFFCSQYQANTAPPVAVGIAQSPTVTPPGPYTAGQKATVTYTAVNKGYGPSLPLKLFVRAQYLIETPIPVPIEHIDFTSPTEAAKATPIDCRLSGQAPHAVVTTNTTTRQLAPLAGLNMPEPPIALPGNWSFSAEAWLDNIAGQDIYKTLPIIQRPKEGKEGKDKEKEHPKEHAKEHAKEKDKEHDFASFIGGTHVSGPAGMAFPRHNKYNEQLLATGQAFILPEERPDVGARILQQQTYE